MTNEPNDDNNQVSCLRINEVKLLSEEELFLCLVSSIAGASGLQLSKR